MLLQDLQNKRLIQCDNKIISNTQYLTIMGSEAYGVSSNNSDIDIYGFCIPSKEEVFPHLKGDIQGFGRQKKNFEQWQQHHIKCGKKEYDFSVYSIVKFFDLCMNNNPNMIDSIFTPRRCVLHSTAIGELVRENRRLFLHKGAWHKFKGYAYSQVHKMRAKKINLFISLCKKFDISTETTLFNTEDELKNNGSVPFLSKLTNEDLLELNACLKQITNKGEVSKRLYAIEKHGFDLKYAYHTVRLLNEIEQILLEGDLDLEKNREQLKAIRRGDWSKKQIFDYFDMKEKSLEMAYASSKLRYNPDEAKIKQLLIDCLEMHYGSISQALTIVNKFEKGIKDIKEIINKLGNVEMV